MSMRKLLFSFVFGAVSMSVSAQEAAAPTAPYRSFSPADQWEVGVHLGAPYVSGDITAKHPGIGGGLHVRKSLDHIFSVRGTAHVGKAKNENSNDTRKSDITWMSGGGELVVALNNLVFNKPVRRVLINAFGGLGVNRYTANYENVLISGTVPTSGDITKTSAYLGGGAGISYRINPKFNIGLEYSVYSTFGSAGDLLDGEENFSNGSSRTSYKDSYHYPHLTLCFNLGGKDKMTGLAKPEPRYWANPLEAVSTAISALEARAIYDPTDTDGDGIINDLDQEDESPAGARVDSKGVTLDSDGDKVPDFKDKEPFSPPGYSVDAMGVANVPKPNYVTEADVNRIVDAKLANFKLPSSAADWFLPMVNFDLNGYTVKNGEFEKLYQVAQVLKANPSLKLVVTGNTDRTSSEKYNNVLSYNRANAAIAHLVAQYGIDRSRLLLNWSGEATNIIPTDAANVVNRRVEFRVAKATDKEAARPEGPEAGKGRIEGNKTGF